MHIVSMAIKDNVMETDYTMALFVIYLGVQTRSILKEDYLSGVLEVLSSYMESFVTVLNLTPGWKYTFNFEMFYENIMPEIEKQWRGLCIFKVLASKPLKMFDFIKANDFGL